MGAGMGGGMDGGMATTNTVMGTCMDAAWVQTGLQLWTRRDTSVCQAWHSQAELGPTEQCTGCSRFLLSAGCEGGRKYRGAHNAGLLPNESRIPCLALVACLVWIGGWGWGWMQARRGPGTQVLKQAQAQA